MANVLRKLFDYQRFEKESGLQKVIDDTMVNANVIRLMDEDLEMVSAGTEIGLPAAGEAGISDEASIPFKCSCGTTIYLKLGEKKCKCPNPKCGRIHVING